MKKICACFATLLWFCQLAGQQTLPTVALQSGLGSYAKASFHFSPKNTYLFGYTDTGDIIFWDLRSGKQLKKFTSPGIDQLKFRYEPRVAFSADEKLILVPDLSTGSYLLYDLAADRIIHEFAPQSSEENEFFTHGLFADDGRILLVGQYKNTQVRALIYIFNNSFKLDKAVFVNLPPLIEKHELLIKLIMGRRFSELNQNEHILSLAIEMDLSTLYFSTISGKMFSLNLNQYTHNQEVPATSLRKAFNISHFLLLSGISIQKSKIIAKLEPTFQLRKDSTVCVTDTIYIFSRSLRLEDKRVARFIYAKANERSNSVMMLPVLNSENLTTYVDYAGPESPMSDVVFKDVLTQNERFRFHRTGPYFWDNASDYVPGSINGGIIAAISNDGTAMAEVTRDLLVHDLSTGMIRQQFSVIKGTYKINQPVMIDSVTMIIPKNYNDAFVFNLSTGRVGRLNRSINCMDTAKRGANVWYPFDDASIIGLSNVFADNDLGIFATADYYPNPCSPREKNKKIQIWDRKTFQPLESFDFHDDLFTFHLSGIRGTKKYLVNAKLVDASKPNPSVKELIIVQKKDTFFAFNPVYIARTRSIFTVMSTRSKPGKPDLLFAHFDENGTLIKFFKYVRPKLRSEIQAYLTESVLSPDSTKLMFSLYDGTAGVFDIDAQKMMTLYEHGIKLSTRMQKQYLHISILAGCFVDNTHFVTSGNDRMIRLWETGQSQQLRVVNQNNPMMLFGLRITPDKKYLYGIASDKTIKFLDLATGNTLWSFSAINQDAYSVVSPEGYYFADKKAATDMAFLYEGRAYEFSQFDLLLNRPDKLLQTIGYASPGNVQYFKNAYEKRVEKMGFDPVRMLSISRFSAPQVHLSGLPVDLKRITGKELRFVVTAVDENFPMTKLFVNVNGVPYYGTRGHPVKNLQRLELPVTLPLSKGVNYVSVSVLNSQGVESFKESFTAISINRTDRPDLHIISIGAGAFAEKSKNLKFPSKDARELVSLFQKDTARYAQVFSYLLLDDKVNRRSVLDLKQKLRNTRPDDVVILFYAGHGVYDGNKNLFLTCYKTDFDAPGKESLSYDDFESLVDSIGSRIKLVFLDACNSGEADKRSLATARQARTTKQNESYRGGGAGFFQEKQGMENSFELMQTVFTDLRRSTGATIIAATGAAEYAYEDAELGNGIFTYCLKKGLTDHQADLNKNGKINISELFAYLQSSVWQFSDGKQRPTGRSENFLNDIEIR